MRIALTELLTGLPGTPSDSAVSHAAQRVSAAARKDGLEAEQMIVALRKEWVVVTGRIRAGGDDPLRDVQSRLITESIRLYYDGGGNGASKSEGKGKH
jgi:hypothetical protein